MTLRMTIYTVLLIIACDAIVMQKPPQEKMGKVSSAQALKKIPQVQSSGAPLDVVDPRASRAKMIMADKINAEFDGHPVEFWADHLIHDELMTTDLVQTSIWFSLLVGPMSAKLMYAGGNLAVLSIIAFVYHERGLMNVIAIMCLILSLSIMSNTIQAVYHLGFRYPEFITACHQLSSAFIAFAMMQWRRGLTGEMITYPQVGTLVKFLAPIAICFGLSLGCSNLALLYSSTHFYEMLTPMSVLVTFMIGYSMGTIKSLKLVWPVLLVSVTVPFVALGETKMSVLGLIFVMLGVLFRSCKAQLNSLLLSGAMPQTFHPLELTCWTSALTFFIMLFWSAIQEGLAPYNAIANMSIIYAVLVTCANATVLNICVLFVMREIGPVAQQILGELKGALASVGAVAAFGEVISVQQMLAYGLAAVGIFLYNRIEHDIKAEEQAAQEQLKS